MSYNNKLTKFGNYASQNIQTNTKAQTRDLKNQQPK